MNASTRSTRLKHHEASPLVATARRRSRPFKPLRERPVASPLATPGRTAPVVVLHPRESIRPIRIDGDVGTDRRVERPVARGADHEVERRAARASDARSPLSRLALLGATLLALVVGSAYLVTNNVATRAAAPDAADRTTSPDASPEPAGAVAGELAELRGRHARLSADLDDARRLADTLRRERDALSVTNDRLNTEIEALIIETTDLNMELLDTELALSAAKQQSTGEVETRVVYNFVNVPLGSEVPPAGAPAPVPPDPEDAGLTAMSSAVSEPSSAMRPNGDEMIAAFYEDVANGMPMEELLESLDAMGESGLVSDENIRVMYQELMYLWEEG